MLHGIVSSWDYFLQLVRYFQKVWSPFISKLRAMPCLGGFPGFFSLFLLIFQPVNCRALVLTGGHFHLTSNNPEVTHEARCIEMTMETEERWAFRPEVHVTGTDEPMARRFSDGWRFSSPSVLSGK